MVLLDIDNTLVERVEAIWLRRCSRHRTVHAPHSPGPDALTPPPHCMADGLAIWLRPRLPAFLAALVARFGADNVYLFTRADHTGGLQLLEALPTPVPLAGVFGYAGAHLRDPATGEYREIAVEMIAEDKKQLDCVRRIINLDPSRDLVMMVDDRPLEIAGRGKKIGIAPWNVRFEVACPSQCKDMPPGKHYQEHNLHDADGELDRVLGLLLKHAAIFDKRNMSKAPAARKIA